MTVKINLSKGNARALTMATLPVTYGQPDASADLTASSTPATSTIAASAVISGQSSYQVWEIIPDVDVWAAFGTSPDPTVASARRFLAAGVTRNFGVQVTGEKVAIIAAT